MKNHGSLVASDVLWNYSFCNAPVNFAFEGMYDEVWIPSLVLNPCCKLTFVGST